MKYLSSTATEAEKQELRKFIKKTKDSRARDRARAVLKRMEGRSRKEIAAFLEVKQDTVSDWITRYRKRGIEGLKSKPQPGNHRMLTSKQREEIKTVVRSKTPKDLGYGRDFWDIPLLARYVREKHEVRYASDRSYHRLFAFIGFTYHKPVKRDKKRKEKMVREFERRLRKKGELVRKMMLQSWLKTR